MRDLLGRVLEESISANKITTNGLHVRHRFLGEPIEDLLPVDEHEAICFPLNDDCTITIESCRRCGERFYNLDTPNSEIMTQLEDAKLNWEWQIDESLCSYCIHVSENLLRE